MVRHSMLVVVMCAGLAGQAARADVWFAQAEGYDEENSLLDANENGLNVTWTLVEDNDALGEKYMTMKGANRDACEACASLASLPTYGCCDDFISWGGGGKIKMIWGGGF